MMKAITAVHRRLTRRAQIQEPVAFFAAVAGTTTTSAVGLPFASGTLRSTGTTTSAFVWFFRRTCSPLYPNSDEVGIKFWNLRSDEHKEKF